MRMSEEEMWTILKSWKQRLSAGALWTPRDDDAFLLISCLLAQPKEPEEKVKESA